MGISDLPVCKRYDFVCQLARRAAKAAVYGDWAQQNIIQVSTWACFDTSTSYLCTQSPHRLSTTVTRTIMEHTL